MGPAPACVGRDESGVQSELPWAPTHTQQHSRGPGGRAHAAPQGAREAAGASWAQLAWLGLRGGNGLEERFCRTQWGQLSHPNHGQPGPFKEAKGQGGWGLGLLSSPHSCLGAGIGTRFSCSVPTKPLQKLGGSERRRATTWAERGVGRGHWQCPEYTPHLRDPSPCTAVACPP